MLSGAHMIIYSRRPAADRAFLRKVLKLPCVDAGDGWLIFGLPPAEVAVHPTRGRSKQELYLMTADIEHFTGSMKRQRIHCEPVRELGWGMLTYLKLPGGGKLGVYQPAHKRPRSMPASRR